MSDSEESDIVGISGLKSMAPCNMGDRDPLLNGRFSVTSPDNKYTTTFTLVSEQEGECTSGRYCSHCSSWSIVNINPYFLDTEHRRNVKSGDARDYGPEGSYCTPEVKEILSDMKYLNYRFNCDTCLMYSISSIKNMVQGGMIYFNRKLQVGDEFIVSSPLYIDTHFYYIEDNKWKIEGETCPFSIVKKDHYSTEEIQNLLDKMEDMGYQHKIPK